MMKTTKFMMIVSLNGALFAGCKSNDNSSNVAIADQIKAVEPKISIVIAAIDGQEAFECKNKSPAINGATFSFAGKQGRNVREMQREKGFQATVIVSQRPFTSYIARPEADVFPAAPQYRQGFKVECNRRQWGGRKTISKQYIVMAEKEKEGHVYTNFECLQGVELMLDVNVPHNLQISFSPSGGDDIDTDVLDKCYDPSTSGKWWSKAENSTTVPTYSQKTSGSYEIVSKNVNTKWWSENPTTWWSSEYIELFPAFATDSRGPEGISFDTNAYRMARYRIPRGDANFFKNCVQEMKNILKRCENDCAPEIAIQFLVANEKDISKFAKSICGSIK